MGLGPTHIQVTAVCVREGGGERKTFPGSLTGAPK